MAKNQQGAASRGFLGGKRNVVQPSPKGIGHLGERTFSNELKADLSAKSLEVEKPALKNTTLGAIPLRRTDVQEVHPTKAAKGASGNAGHVKGGSCMITGD